MSLLEKFKSHPTRRAEFAALLQEPAMQDAIAIVREQIFMPRPLVPGTPDLIACRALLAEKREGYLEMLTNFLSLANITPFKLPEKKPWDTIDAAAAEQRLRSELLGPEPTADAPVASPGPSAPPSETPNP